LGRHPDTREWSLVGRILLGRRVVDRGRIVIRRDRIIGVSREGSGAADFDLGDSLVIPGLIDPLVGADDLITGPDAIRGLARALAVRGVTAFLPSIASAPMDVLADFVVHTATARDRQHLEREAGNPMAEAEILGAHVEGPALNVELRGAHPISALSSPAAVLEALKGHPERWTGLRMMTLAPELPGALELVRYLAMTGRIASVGHTAANYGQAWEAFEAGARSVTHLFNGMRPMHHRDPGVVAAALNHPSVFVQLIVDGIHVDPVTWPIVWRLVGDRLVLVSDAVLGLDGQNGGPRRTLDTTMRVRDGRIELQDGTLAGSTATLERALANVLTAGLPVVAASHATSLAAALLLGLVRKGRIRQGADADLAVVRPDGQVHGVIQAGRWVEDDAEMGARLSHGDPSVSVRDQG
jgi:N-acetylglucosamine-6-phosphate deacetylase